MEGMVSAALDNFTAGERTLVAKVFGVGVGVSAAETERASVESWAQESGRSVGEVEEELAVVLRRLRNPEVRTLSVLPRSRVARTVGSIPRNVYRRNREELPKRA